MSQTRRWSLFSLERTCRSNFPKGKMKNQEDLGASGSCSFSGPCDNEQNSAP